MGLRFKHVIKIAYPILPLFVCLLFTQIVGPFSSEASETGAWTQWRGAHRTGLVDAHPWPERLKDDSVKLLWRIEAGPSYSSPVLTEDLVFTTETVEERDERVLAIERATGETRWTAGWNGAMNVPFFARANGSWIRSTPATDGERLYVAGMNEPGIGTATCTIRGRIDALFRSGRISYSAFRGSFYDY